MVDFLIAATLSNLLVSTTLAGLAWIVQRRIPSPGLANLLWVIVMIKLITPPLVGIPAMTIPSISGSDISAPSAKLDVLPVAEFDSSFGPADATPKVVATSATSGSYLSAAEIACFVWLAVSAVLFAVSGVRILRFHWLLMRISRVDQQLSRSLALSIARQFGLRRAPDILVTAANIAPFVWWLSGRCVVVVSSRAMEELNQTDIRLIITHEMAHVKRRDHWFRWLEWIALIAFWWNPIMWWARRQLRTSEEMACDQLVLQTAKSEVNQYANSLLNMAELLASSEIRPPVVASAINSGGILEKRLNVMMNGRHWMAPAALRTTVVAMAMCLFPLGFVYAQSFEAVERRLGGAVESGELSLEQAKLMMEALRHSVHGDRELEAKKHRYMMFTKEIKAAVEAGKLSEEEAEEKLMHLRREMFEVERHDGNASRELQAKKRRYEQAAVKIKEAHEAGKLSEEEAEEKLMHLRREMFAAERHDGEEDDGDENESEDE